MLFSAAECFNGRIPELSRAPVTRPGDLSASHGAQPRISRCRVTCHQLIQLRKSAKCGCGYLQTSKESPLPGWTNRNCQIVRLWKNIVANVINWYNVHIMPSGPTGVQFGTDCLQRTGILRNHGFTMESWSSKFASMSSELEVEFCWDSDRLRWSWTAFVYI